MCKKSKNDVKVLKDRTKGLDSRGNVAVNTQAESNWAVETLSGLDDPAAASLMTDLKRVYDGTVNGDRITKLAAGKFHKGYRKFFGADGNRVPTKPELVSLMLESEYDFKEAVDALNRGQKKQNKPLWEKCRNAEEFQDRGRIQGRQRRNSFVGPHAGITDHTSMQGGMENFFSKEVVHAKGTFEGDPKSETYQRFVQQGAPFIGGVSGTMQGLSMAWEQEQPLESIEDPVAQGIERARREKMAGIYMATLLAGGHHSASEMLFSAKSYGLFPNVTDPLTNYPLAMQQFGNRLTELGLPGDLSPKASRTWLTATQAVADSLDKLRVEIADTYKDEDYADDLERAFERAVQRPVEAFFTDELAEQLDEIVGNVDDDDEEEREDAVREAARLIQEARDRLDDDIIAALDTNPFLPLTIRKTISAALDQVAGLAR